MRLTIQLRFHTRFGQSLCITGDHPVLGSYDPARALPMEYFDKEYWHVQLQFNPDELPDKDIAYHFILKNEDGAVLEDREAGRRLHLTAYKSAHIVIIDSWNNGAFYQNAFYTEPFREVLLKKYETPLVTAQPLHSTHYFSVRSPLLQKGQVLCIAGSVPALGNWNTTTPLLMNRNAGTDDWYIHTDMQQEDFPVAYKYGIYDLDNQLFVGFEDGQNRIIYSTPGIDKQTIINDGFTFLPANTWKGAGVAIPVFSLRSRRSMGAGSFTDLKLLADWAAATGLQLIQILPVNDTTASYTWTDCYPYAAISAFALHPVYLDLYEMAGPAHQEIVTATLAEQQRLEALDVMDYEGVIQLKLKLAKELFALQGTDTLASADFKDFFETNKHWLAPYASFCYLRDTYGTAQFTAWPEYNTYNNNIPDALFSRPASRELMQLCYFMQYHLHLQLRAAAAYAHEKGVVLKGDIPIGIFRNSADAWQSPDQYHMDMQAGAPPDAFAVKGQNWGFPTYNWTKMKLDGFAWWKQRMEQMGHYFDAFRIDHILGFFRIWSIPMHAVEGILGYFVPAIPVHRSEFYEKDILFDDKRYTVPYITDDFLEQVFGGDAQEVIQTFLLYGEGGHYSLKPEFTTQQQVAWYFATKEGNEHTRKLQQGLFDLISNVILLEVDDTNGQQFHFRFDMQDTYSFRSLDGNTQYRLQRLYTNYFFERQDQFWKGEAMQKLPALQQVTNMLICGEDLGLVPASVPEVMQQLGLLSLEVQRMPKQQGLTFFNPADAPYLSVVTPSTHDMSTIRGWWEEDRILTQLFYNQQLHQPGEAPFFCDAAINKAIVAQHLDSPAMWSIFQLQDLMGIDEAIRRDNPYEERINIPADPRHYWRYRIHLTLEDLLGATAFNTMLEKMVKAGGR